MTVTTLEQIRNEFLHEAESAPKLFKDLAKVEQYIAESYKTRALIELIQNADDAGATDFGFHNINGGFIVGNNGRTFTLEDVEALCRSGSSNKQRGGSTIGYRGIGFKSVVNIANRILIYSGDFSFYFDRSQTKNCLKVDVDVPLIRVPHLIEINGNELFEEVFQLKVKFNYTTVFVFQDVIENISLAELSNFDKSSLLFLNNLKSLVINFKEVNRKIFVTQLNNNYENKTQIRITEENEEDEWEVETSKNNRADRVAYKKINGEIVPALLKESVIHSFTPTNEFAGGYIKINGDYTTDPSRKTVDFDELSTKSFQNSIDTIVSSVISILNGNLKRKGFFTPFINIQLLESSRFKTMLFKGIQTNIEKLEIVTQSGISENFTSIRTKPEWLNYEDYEKLCFESIVPIPKEMISVYPELFSFLGILNVRTLNLDEAIQRINVAGVSVIGAAQVFDKIIKQYRYDLSTDKIEKLKELDIFPVNDVSVKATEIKNASVIHNEFMAYLRNNSDGADIAMVLKKMGIELERELVTNNQTGKLFNYLIERKQDTLFTAFKNEPTIKKWRSAEQNAAEYLRSLTIVLSVKDVTQANLGYDLEVMLSNGKRLYIEVKSVSSFSEPFKISNNEYTSAHSYGNDYYIAIVINDDAFIIKFVPNPLKALSFEKKCERWSWYCEQYVSDLQETNEVFIIK